MKSLVFDGHAVNVSTLKELTGNKAAFDEIRNHFYHDGDKIYFMFDACHMLKVLRNIFQTLGTLNYNSKSADWAHLVRLHEIQEENFIKLANKISKNHIHFQNMKMKVKLAAQLFSASVSNALLALDQLKILENADGTAALLRVRTFLNF